MEQSARDRQVQRVLMGTLAANLLVAAAKIIVGLATRSLAMVSDGVHSSLDATSNIVGLVSVRLASRPPDETHPYGHRRFETLASMLIGGLLMLTAWEIVKGSINRLSQNVTPEITTVSFAVMVVTILINIGVSTFEAREGKRLQSEILNADSHHTRSDIFVSLTVLASLIAVRLGYGWLDAAAALVVVVLIAIPAWDILSRSVNVLVDRAPLEPGRVERVVREVPGVEHVTQVRSRGSLGNIHIDLDVQVPAPTTADQSAAIAREIRERLGAGIEGLEDIRIYFLPTPDVDPDVAQVARAEGDALGLGVHEVIPVQDAAGRLKVDMHVELPPALTVGEAHELVTQLEDRLRAAIPDLTRVVTHMEPAHRGESARQEGPSARELAAQAHDLAAELYPEVSWHDLEIRLESDGGYALSMHGAVSPATPLEAAHRIAEEVETAIRATLPQFHRVTIHTEPPDVG
ncbi:MAG TPA: cation diffusion facilitator family transporter [Aggregatilineales bacterium]|nr:cation diffusion facilitator family transporter [Aggregatilineales bacterium]